MTARRLARAGADGPIHHGCVCRRRKGRNANLRSNHRAEDQHGARCNDGIRACARNLHMADEVGGATGGEGGPALLNVRLVAGC